MFQHLLTMYTESLLELYESHPFSHWMFLSRLYHLLPISLLWFCLPYPYVSEGKMTNYELRSSKITKPLNCSKYLFREELAVCWKISLVKQFFYTCFARSRGSQNVLQIKRLIVGKGVECVAVRLKACLKYIGVYCLNISEMHQSKNHTLNSLFIGRGEAWGALEYQFIVFPTK